MLAIPSPHSVHSGGPDAGTHTIINQILFILSIDVEDNMGTREYLAFMDKQPLERPCPEYFQNCAYWN